MVRARQGSHAEASQRHHMTGKCMKWLKVEMFLIRPDKGYEAKGMVFHDELLSTSFKGKVKSLSVMRDANRTRQEKEKKQALPKHGERNTETWGWT